ncbi:hypothetical protein F442_22693 [Phytophthora nicotianae P10297]|uniref:Uncharacterized protein n=1 Tax=Phytophthora nicotianae P10297 TaxID=1317064 RepID=W2XZ76_PHYNI|nr:hypothetical protein F442_22693 [Phytophthora nicotianae P10297]
MSAKFSRDSKIHQHHKLNEHHQYDQESRRIREEIVTETVIAVTTTVATMEDGISKPPAAPVGDGGDARRGAPAGQVVMAPHGTTTTSTAQAAQQPYGDPATSTWVYQAPRHERKLRLPKFKGLDEPKLTVKA